MPAVEVVGLPQKAVLWPFLKHDSHGDPVMSSPVEVRVRWEKRVSELLEGEEGPVTVNVAVYVDREMTSGSILRLGTMDDLPAEPDRLAEVVDFDETPDLKGRNVQRTVTLRRWRVGLPTVV